jgi:hypothetical protein
MVIRIHKSKKSRQHYDQKKKYKQHSTKHTHKTKDRAIWATVNLIKRYDESLFSQKQIVAILFRSFGFPLTYCGLILFRPFGFPLWHILAWSCLDPLVSLWHILAWSCLDPLVFLSDIFWPDPVLTIWVSCSQRLISYLAFQSFDYQFTWWKLFQKRVVRTKLDIYVLVKIQHQYKCKLWN